MPTEPATPDTLGVPGSEETEPAPTDPLVTYLADGSFYAAAAGFLLPGLTLFLVSAFIWDSESAFLFLLLPALFSLFGPAAVVLGILAQRRPGVAWRNGTAWGGIILGVVDTLAYTTIFAALFGFVA